MQELERYQANGRCLPDQKMAMVQITAPKGPATK
jgi:hypothetical protein